MKDKRMVKKYLDFKPIQWLCPYCGEWHPWSKDKLNTYNFSKPAVLTCINFAERKTYRIGFKKEWLGIDIRKQCTRASFDVTENFKYENVEVEKNSLTFTVSFKPKSPIGEEKCNDCSKKHICHIKRLADEKGNNDEMSTLKIKLGFKMDANDKKLQYFWRLMDAEKEAEEADFFSKEKTKILRRLLDLKPTKYLCYNCGKWHEWLLPKPLSHCTSMSRSNANELTCEYNYLPLHGFFICMNDNPESEKVLIQMIEFDKHINKGGGIVAPLCAFELDRRYPRIYDKKRNIGFEFSKKEYDDIVRPYLAELRNANN